MVSRWSNFPIFTARNGQIKVWPLYMEHPAGEVATNIVVGGCAPVSVTLAGVDCHTYQPSGVFGITTHGDAHITVTTAGVLCATYRVPPYGVDLGGEAPVTTNIGGIEVFCYPATGGITMGGAADATFITEERGGKGTPMFRRERQKQATHYYFAAEAFFENTLQLGGEATAIFRPAPYAFIKSLPKVPYTPPRRDSEFVDLFKKLEAQPKTNTFSYQATGGVTTAGNAADEYFNFRDFILAHDEELIIADILSSDGSPFITTTFDQNLARLKRDDDEVIEIFELL